MGNAGHGSERPHATGVEPGVALAHPLVVLGGDQRDDGDAVGNAEQRDLLAVKPLFEHHGVAGVAHRLVGQQVEDGAFGFDPSLGHDHTLAGGQTVGLDHHIALETIEPFECGIDLGKRFRDRSRDAVPGGKGASERLRSFKLSGRRRGSEAGDTGKAQIIGKAGNQRGLRSDDDKIDVVADTEFDDRQVRADIELDVQTDGRRVAGRDVEPTKHWRSRKAFGHGVLAASRTDQEDTEIARAHPRTPSNRCFEVSMVSCTGTG